MQAHLGICENPIVDAYLFSRSQELERGIGFSIFQELARKYDGRFSYHAENGRFTASLILKGASLAQHCDL